MAPLNIPFSKIFESSCSFYSFVSVPIRLLLNSYQILNLEAIDTKILLGSKFKYIEFQGDS